MDVQKFITYNISILENYVETPYSKVFIAAVTNLQQFKKALNE